VAGRRSGSNYRGLPLNLRPLLDSGLLGAVQRSDMLRSAIAPAFLPHAGGRGPNTTSPASCPVQEWKGIGVLYCKETDPPEFRVVYPSTIPREVKNLVAEIFSVGALEWSVCSK
jgi:hypothetical protein